MSQRTDEFIEKHTAEFRRDGVPEENKLLAAENLLAVYAIATSPNAMVALGRMLMQLGETWDTVPLHSLKEAELRDFTPEEWQEALNRLRAQPDLARRTSINALLTTGMMAFTAQAENAKRQYTAPGSTAKN